MKTSQSRPKINKLWGNTHFQTIWPNYFRKKPNLSLASQKVDLPDGDFLEISKIDSPNHQNNERKNIVLIFHGLGGSIQSHYALSLMLAMAKHDLQPIFVHFRGASGKPNNKTISYHAGKTDDIAFVINKVKAENPNNKLFTIGISIGGSALLNYLGRDYIGNPLEAAAAVSVPYDLHDAAISLNKGFARAYQRHLLRCQQQSLNMKFEAMECPIDLTRALMAKSFYEFDDTATAPLHGFEGVMDYYNQCSAKQYLKNIDTPTLLIHAKDDPFMSEKSIPQKQDLSKTTELELHDKGGHVGFVEGAWPWRFEYYLDRRIAEFFMSFT